MRWQTSFDDCVVLLGELLRPLPDAVVAQDPRSLLPVILRDVDLFPGA